LAHLPALYFATSEPRSNMFLLRSCRGSDISGR